MVRPLCFSGLPPMRPVLPSAFKPASPPWVAPPALTPPVSDKLYPYLGPMQSAALFSAGVATAWLGAKALKAVFSPKLSREQLKKLFDTPVAQMAQGSTHIEKQRSINLTNGIETVLWFAMESDNPVIRRIKGYLASVVLGYLAGTSAQGVQEIWVRREETQIRANLLKQLSRNFQESIQTKNRMDDRLLKQTKSRILTMLRDCNIPFPETLLQPTPDVPVERQYRYFNEPIHFDRPSRPIAGLRPAFGSAASVSGAVTIPTQRKPMDLPLIKALTFGAGVATGTVALIATGLLKAAPRHAWKPPSKMTTKVFYNIITASGTEGFFLIAPISMVATLLGLSAAAKSGKLLVDGYKEVEVTRQHALTELRYQTYNWLHLDPNYHWIAENEAVEHSLQRLREAIGGEYRNRRALSERIQTILTNIGRNSMPKYMPMTPFVALTPAKG